MMILSLISLRQMRTRDQTTQRGLGKAMIGQLMVSRETRRLAADVKVVSYSLLWKYRCRLRGSTLTRFQRIVATLYGKKIHLVTNIIKVVA